MESHSVPNPAIEAVMHDQEVLETIDVRFYVSSMIITVCYVFGMVGNLVAIYAINSKSTYKNKTYFVLLRYMATNNFVALLGMFVLYKTQIYLPVEIYEKFTKQFCAFRVVWRFFGFNSGCIAVVMATERWLALTRPFIYRKIVTQSMTRKSLIGFGIFAALLSVAPLTGFGAYFNAAANTCLRYRDGRDPIDVAYAFTFFSFGTLLIVWIVVCNMSVTKTLYDAKWSRTFINPLLTRSQEEIRFARLMMFLSISFVVCWLPQMTSIILAQYFNEWRFRLPFCKLADLLMVLHFIIDPYIYVLVRCKQDQGSNDDGKKGSLVNSNTVQEVVFLDKETTTSATGGSNA